MYGTPSRRGRSSPAAGRSRGVGTTAALSASSRTTGGGDGSPPPAPPTADDAVAPLGDSTDAGTAGTIECYGPVHQFAHEVVYDPASVSPM